MIRNFTRIEIDMSQVNALFLNDPDIFKTLTKTFCKGHGGGSFLKGGFDRTPRTPLVTRLYSVTILHHQGGALFHIDDMRLLCTYPTPLRRYTASHLPEIHTMCTYSAPVGLRKTRSVPILYL